MRTVNVTNLQFPAFPQMDHFRMGCHAKAPGKAYAICTRRAGHSGRHSSGGFRIIHFVWPNERRMMTAHELDDAVRNARYGKP